MLFNEASLPRKLYQLVELTSTLFKVSSLLQESLECAPPLFRHRRNPFSLKVISMLLIYVLQSAKENTFPKFLP